MSPPPQHVTSSSVQCLHCGYDLTGVPIGGQCPECGAPVSAAFRAARAPTSGKAVASMVLGIVSIPGCFASYGVISLICGILAIIFWKQASDDITAGAYSAGSRSMARAGLICGLVGLGLTALVVVLVLLLFLGMSGSFSITTPPTPPTPVPSPPTP